MQVFLLLVAAAIVMTLGGYMWEGFTGDNNQCCGGIALTLVIFVLVAVVSLMREASLTPQEKAQRDNATAEAARRKAAAEAAADRERRLAEQRMQARRQLLENVHTLSGSQFESMTQDLFQHMGYSVTRTQATRDDGVDLILRDGDRRVLVQCKRQQKPVGVKVVRELFGVLISSAADKGIVITNNTFTSDAEVFARGKRLELVDGATFARWYAEHVLEPSQEA